MKIDRVTITGADNTTLDSDLIKLSKEYPFVEWGILFSQSKEGQRRYPDIHWIDNIMKIPGLNLAAHFCGYHARAVLEQHRLELLDLYKTAFKRIQLNYNFQNSDGRFSFTPIVDWAERNPDNAIILQYNKSNAGYITKFPFPKNIHFLYDSSGGRGIEINTVNQPFLNRYTGYAGGIGPKNIKLICEELANGESNDNIWIDMENGVRSEPNYFNLDRVEIVLLRAEKYIQ